MLFMRRIGEYGCTVQTSFGVLHRSKDVETTSYEIETLLMYSIGFIARLPRVLM
jgi:hypothetical protein